MRLSRRGLLAAAAASLAAGCTGDGEDGGQTIRVGWITPLSGPYKDIGEEMRNGVQLYLDVHDNVLGGRKVELVTVDEGAGPDDAYPAAEKLVKSDNVVALAGLVNSDSYKEIAELAQKQRIPLIGAAGRPELDPKRLQWLWHVSWIDSEPGEALAPYVHSEVSGPVYAIGPDFQGGRDQVEGFTKAFKDLGGELANSNGKPTWTKFPGDNDFDSYLSEAAFSGAGAIYAYYTGEQAVEFVKQHAASEAKDIPLYGAFLTEGPVLAEQAGAAKGVRSAMNYAVDLDNEANREFVAEWKAVHDSQPSLYSMCAWDAGVVLDRAIDAIDDSTAVTPKRINDAISKMGSVESPRGAWRFSKEAHAPIQNWYLREVRKDGQQLSNIVIDELDTLGG